MKISLRKLPPEIEKAILETSRRAKISPNKATLALLEQALKKPARNTDFDEFAGTWSREESAQFDAAIEAIRKIDSEEWTLAKVKVRLDAPE